MFRERSMPRLIVNDPNPETKKFKETMSLFAANCLIDKPKDIIAYGAVYFEDLLENQDLFERPVMSRSAISYGTSITSNEDISLTSTKSENPNYDESKTDMLNRSIEKCILFKSLDFEARQKVFHAMTTRETKPEEIIIQQGEEGHHFFIVERGKFEAYDEDKLIKVYEDSGSFGELALLYDKPRAATIISKDYGLLWVVERKAFKKIVMKASIKKRQIYEEFFSRVPVLEPLTIYEKQLLADSTVSEFYNDGDVIIMEDEPALGMYFIEKGQVKVEVNGQVVNVLGPSQYFGELALLMKQPRLASVIAMGNVKVAYVSVEAFENLLGSCVEMMKKNVVTYHSQISNTLDTETSLLIDLSTFASLM